MTPDLISDMTATAAKLRNRAAGYALAGDRSRALKCRRAARLLESAATGLRAVN